MFFVASIFCFPFLIVFFRCCVRWFPNDDFPVADRRLNCKIVFCLILCVDWIGTEESFDNGKKVINSMITKWFQEMAKVKQQKKGHKIHIFAPRFSFSFHSILFWRFSAVVHRHHYLNIELATHFTNFCARRILQNETNPMNSLLGICPIFHVIFSSCRVKFMPNYFPLKFSVGFEKDEATIEKFNYMINVFVVAMKPEVIGAINSNVLN